MRRLLAVLVIGLSSLASAGSKFGNSGAGTITIGTPNGLSLITQQLSLAAADGTHAGALTSGAQTIGGAKTFAAAITASNLSGTNSGDITIGTANGLSLVGQVLSLNAAGAATIGVVTTSTQTFAGAKTFSSTISASNLSGTNSGDITIGSGNGLSLAGQILSLGAADGSNAGALTSGTQTIGGAKTFSAAITASNLSGTNSGDITIATVGSTPAAAGASLSGQVLTLQPADGTNAGLVSTTTQTFAGAKTFSTSVASPSLSSSAASGSNGVSLLTGARAYFGATNAWISSDAAGSFSFGGGTTGTGVTAANIVGLAVVRGVSFNPVTAAVPLKLTSEQTAAGASATVPGGYFKCFTALDATDVCFDVRDSADVQMFTVMQSGKVGIGTNAPSAKFQVDVDGTISNTALINSPSASWPSLSLGLGGTAKAYFGVARTTNDGVVGTVANDALIRTQGGKIVISVDSGVTAAATMQTTGSMDFNLGARHVPRALPTCAVAIEGQVEADVLSGAATGKRTKLCLCTSDGSSAYKWQNVATATLGTTTTCGTE